MPGTEQTQDNKTAEAQAATDTALDNFQWDDTGGGDFFGIAETGTKEDVKPDVVSDVKKEDGKEPTPKADTKKEGEEEDEEEDSFFDIVDKPGETKEGEEDQGSDEDVDKDYYKTLASRMKEDGIFQNVDIPEGEDFTEDKFIELQDLEIDSRVEEAFEGFFSELDADGAAFLKHKKEGGSTEDFFKTYGQSTGAPQGDLDDESYQEQVSRYYYEQEGEDPEDIDDKIEWLKDSGKLEKYAQKFDGKLKENDKKTKEDLANNTKAAEKTAEEGRLAFATSVQEALEAIEEVDNFKFTKESKKTLLPFITKATVKVGKNKHITGMQDKLSATLKDPNKMLVLAQLLQNDFDVSSIINSATTAKTKTLKDDIQRKKTSVRPTNSGKAGSRKSLSEFF